MGFEEIANSEAVEVSLHRELNRVAFTCFKNKNSQMDSGKGEPNYVHT